MATTRKKRSRRGLALPLILITLGLVFLLDNLGALQGDLKTVIFRLWPILIIIAGIDNLFRSRGVFGPVILIGGGFVFLLGGFDLLDGRSTWSVVLRLWPVLVVAFGLELLAAKRSLWGSALCVLLSLLIMGGALWLIGVRMPPEADAAGSVDANPLEKLASSLPSADGGDSIQAAGGPLMEPDSVREDSRESMEPGSVHTGSLHGTESDSVSTVPAP